MDYITAEDKTRLEEQVKECVSKRKIITKRIEEARALGDLKENAEYHAAREDQGMNEARIRELESKLAKAVVTDSEDLPDDIVFVGATVKLREVESGDEDLYRLVGEASGSLDHDYVEVTPNSPMGQALMKARIGEVVRVDLRRGPKRFEVVEILS
ncbi:MAG: transcription elongation factor GreA [Phycisphaerales bacterium]|nr:transcription elongation factor GreA [Phycisphaerae bacterium]NNF43775.1 transcription elongation factor GreA [Phycisphaerales bacterium]NNM25681.1 transcription elongation factor GreA [Phycisphaerales bacterium]